MLEMTGTPAKEICGQQWSHPKREVTWTTNDKVIRVRLPQFVEFHIGLCTLAANYGLQDLTVTADVSLTLN